MARFISVVLLMAIASYIAVMLMPWWSPMIIAFLLILLLPMKSGKAFLATATGAAIAFVVMSTLADLANQHILSSKMAVLFHMPSFVLMIIVTALIGFVTAGLGGWTGAALYQLFRNKNI